jgi:hypothetical protein
MAAAAECAFDADDKVDLGAALASLIVRALITDIGRGAQE